MTGVQTCALPIYTATTEIYTVSYTLSLHDALPLYLRLLRGIDAVYESPTPYIAAWHQAPVHVGRDTVRLNLQITSPRRAADKLKFLAGSESAMGAWIGDVPPEVAADRLRTAIEGIVL